MDPVTKVIQWFCFTFQGLQISLCRWVTLTRSHFLVKSEVKGEPGQKLKLCVFAKFPFGETSALDEFCARHHYMESQVGVVVISCTCHLWSGVASQSSHVHWDCQSQSDSKGFSPWSLVFLLLQIRLPCQDLSCWAIEHKPLARKNGLFLCSWC